jgi:HEAT repeat protein
MMVLLNLGDGGLPPVLCVLTNPTNPVRLAAIYALASPEAKYSFTPGLVDVLTHCLNDADPEVACGAAGILYYHHVNQERALRTLVEAIEGNDELRKQYAVSILRDPVLLTTPATNLIQYLQDTNSALSPYAATALGQRFENNISTRTVILPALTNGLRDPRRLVRSRCADVLGRLGQAAEPAVPALLDAWNDPDESVRQAATNAFFGLPSYNVLTPMPVGMLEGRYGMSWAQAQMYELRYGLSLHKPALTNLLNHSDIRVRQMATNALSKLSQ